MGTLALVKGFDEILYISCNPLTLIDNLKKLTKTHTIEALAFFDQFPYTPHLECGVHLHQRSEATHEKTSQTQIDYALKTSLSRWQLEGDFIRRDFEFKDFVTAWGVP